LMTNEGLMPPTLTVACAEGELLGARRTAKFPEGCAALGTRSAMQAYEDTGRTGAMDGEGLDGPG
jgi:hypothetical protein